MFGGVFERLVDRSGEHHLWRGAIDSERGTGRFKVGGRVIRAHRIAWEIEHGALPPGARVSARSVEPGCVRVEHLSARTGDGELLNTSRSESSVRSRKGSGSVRQVRRGVWKLTATGRYADGSTRRVYRTVYVDTEAEARVELARLVVEVHETDRTISAEAVRTSFDDAVRRYLYEHLLEERGRDPRTAEGTKTGTR